MLSMLSHFDKALTHHVQLESSDVLRYYYLALRALKMQGVKRALDNAGAALNAALCSWYRGNMPALI